MSTTAYRSRLPLAEVLRVKAGRTTRLVVVLCPLCGKKHTHGLPYGRDPETYVQTRVRHCDWRARARMDDATPSQYILVFPAGLGPQGVTHP